MGTQQMDALSSFVYLAENVPLWLAQVNDLSVHTQKRHSEFAAEYSRLLKHARPRKQKSPSLISNRSNEKPAETEPTSPKSHLSSSYPASDARLELNPLEAGNKYLFANARRKKKNTGASVRSGASGPQKFRQRHAVVIYYDGHVQESFESMVKNISLARNNLRKGKKARDLARGPVFPSFNTRPTDSFKRTVIMAQVNLSAKPDDDAFSQSSPSPSSTDACFDLVDKALEQAQQLCETAAHQFLRDGDTSLEMQSTKEKLEHVLELTKDTIEKLKDEERAQKELDESEEAAAADDDQDSCASVSSYNNSTPPDIKLDSAGAQSKGNPLAAIEVDDDDGGADEDPLAGFNLDRYRTMLRSTAVRV